MKFIALLGSPNAVGRTRLVAEAIATGVGQANGQVDMISVAGGPSDEIIQACDGADGLLFGCPVYRGGMAYPLKMLLDHMPRGMVMGWFSPEMDMFHGSQLEHDERYAFGQEWLDLVRKLWSEPGSFDFHGKFFQGEGLEAYPKPYQAPQPVLINAGNSPSGVDFSARNVDINFASLDTIETMTDYTKNIRRRARDEYERDISTMTYGLVVVRDTEKEAKDAFQAIIDHGDWGAAGNVMKVAGMESQSFNEQIKKFQERFIAGWAGYPVVGTPEQVVEELGRLNTAGMDGMIMGFLDYNEEMKYFGEHVLPLMKQADLRHD
jgi:alkanesulfonate monooxygenase SsuD/methylene tetrahydromethanopterin reductase-like flavin-dependent oxidoreductase (luciferase family)